MLSGKYAEAEKFYKTGLESAKQFGNRSEEAKGIYKSCELLMTKTEMLMMLKQKLETALQISKAIRG
ncbi:MAG: hypothetical protein MZV64_56975 [Ignavibacteriales bacterium]|nr:hypothetical protein [Ignavibacteriales bacterium]